MLMKNKYFVYDFDHINQSALHWAAKRNHKEIVDLLIENGANVNHVDIVRYYLINNNFYIRVVGQHCIWQLKRVILLV